MFLGFDSVDLPFSTSEDFLQKEFSAFGEIAEGVLLTLMCFQLFDLRLAL